jgi:ribulose-phosphate 3-epimerase
MKPPLPMGGVALAPSILSADFSQLGTELRKLLRAGCSWIHLDIMDNHFVPNLTFGPPVVKALRKVSPRLYFDAHLMIDNPETVINAFADAGVQHLTVHQEACPQGVSRTLRLIREAGMRTGISLKPDTSVSTIEPHLGEVDMVLVMTVEPGFGGQAIIPSCLNKVRTLKRHREAKRRNFLIQVDGGVNLDTVGLAVAAGSDVLVAGSAVFGGAEVAENIAAMNAAIQRAIHS